MVTSRVYKVLEGTKYQVYTGIAKQTTGGLTKKDIVKVDQNGTIRYKSKKQQANGSSRNKVSQQGRQLWARSYKKALKTMQEKDDYYNKNVLMFKPGKKYNAKFNKTTLKKGQALYKLTKEIQSGAAL
tara:strand:+ start:664 stop:1047 length:384 start_codon:yes stop_codon:yes gene_type:complete